MNKFRYTTIGQMLQILKTYSINAILFAIVWVMLANLWSTGVGRYIYVVISLVTMGPEILRASKLILPENVHQYIDQLLNIWPL